MTITVIAIQSLFGIIHLILIKGGRTNKSTKKESNVRQNVEFLHMGIATPASWQISAKTCNFSHSAAGSP